MKESKLQVFGGIFSYKDNVWVKIQFILTIKCNKLEFSIQNRSLFTRIVESSIVSIDRENMDNIIRKIINMY